MAIVVISPFSSYLKHMHRAVQHAWTACLGLSNHRSSISDGKVCLYMLECDFHHIA